jgi:hypothetical protein
MNSEEFYKFLTSSKYFKGGNIHLFTTGDFECHFMKKDNFDIKDYYSIKFSRNNSIVLYRDKTELVHESMILLIARTEEQYIDLFMNRIIDPLQITVKELLELE